MPTTDRTNSAVPNKKSGLDAVQGVASLPSPAPTPPPVTAAAKGDFSTWRCFCISNTNKANNPRSPKLFVADDGTILNTANDTLHDCSADELQNLDEDGRRGGFGVLGCVFENICVAPSYELGNVSIYVDKHDAAAQARLNLLPKKLHQELRKVNINPSLANESPLSNLLRQNSDAAAHRYQVGDTIVVRRVHDAPVWNSPHATGDSLAIVTTSLHPFNAYHTLQDFFPLMHYLLDAFAIPKRIWAAMTAFDIYMWPQYNITTVKAPKFMKLESIQSDVNNGVVNNGVKRVCFQRPVLLLAGGLYGSRDPADRRRFRDHFMRVHLGDKEVDAIETRLGNTVCNGAASVVYVSRKGTHRGVSNEPVLLRYLELLEHLGAKVNRLNLAYSTPMEEQMRAFANANIAILPHGASMAHTIWMPLECGVAADLLNSKQNAQICTPFMGRIVQNFAKLPHLVWWPPKYSDTNTHYNPDLKFDAHHFHLQLERYLMAHPTSGSVQRLGEQLVAYNTTTLTAWMGTAPEP